MNITLTIDDQMAERLLALAGPSWDERTVEAVVMTLADHAQQGACRSGSWERGWDIQVFGDEWLVNMEPDPDAPPHTGWQRPIAAGGR